MDLQFGEEVARHRRHPGDPGALRGASRCWCSPPTTPRPMSWRRSGRSIWLSPQTCRPHALLDAVTRVAAGETALAPGVADRLVNGATTATALSERELEVSHPGGPRGCPTRRSLGSLFLSQATVRPISCMSSPSWTRFTDGRRRDCHRARIAAAEVSAKPCVLRPAHQPACSGRPSA